MIISLGGYGLIHWKFKVVWTHLWYSFGCLVLMWFFKVPVEVFPIPLYVAAQTRHFWISLFLVKYSSTFEAVLIICELLGIWTIDDDDDEMEGTSVMSCIWIELLISGI